MTDSAADAIAVNLDGQFETPQYDVFELRRRLDNLLGILGEIDVLAEGGLRKRAHNLHDEILNHSTRVTLVGQVKAGKTALTNVLADASNLLPSDVNPWTSVVTTLHINKPAPDGQHAIFDFFAPDEWQKLMQGGGRLGEMARRAQHADELARLREQLEAMRETSERRLGHKFELLMGNTHRFAEFSPALINRYVCLGDPEDNDKDGQYADVTKSAQLYLSSDSYPMPVSLRDTPGVNDPFLVREQITLNSLADTDICVIVLSAHQAMSTVDMALLRIIMALKTDQIILFINRIDELDKPSAALPEIESAIRHTLAQNALPEDVDIIFGSAVWGDAVLTGRLEAIPPSSRDALQDLAERNEALDRAAFRLSGIPALRETINEKICAQSGKSFLNAATRRCCNLLGQMIALLDRAEAAGPSHAVMLSDTALESKMDDIARKHALAVEKRLNSAIFALRQHMTQAVEGFIASEVTAIASALEQPSGLKSWDVDSNVIRRYLKGGYDEFGAACTQAIAQVYDVAAVDIGRLYVRLCGPDQVEIAPPNLPEIPVPIVLGRTLSIDLGRGWWTHWLGATRSAEAVVKDMRGALTREIAPLVREIELEHATSIMSAAKDQLDAFFAEHSETLGNLCALNDEGLAAETRKRLGLASENPFADQTTLTRMRNLLAQISTHNVQRLAQETLP